VHEGYRLRTESLRHSASCMSALRQMTNLVAMVETDLFDGPLSAQISNNSAPARQAEPLNKLQSYLDQSQQACASSDEDGTLMDTDTDKHMYGSRKSLFAMWLFPFTDTSMVPVELARGAISDSVAAIASHSGDPVSRNKTLLASRSVLANTPHLVSSALNSLLRLRLLQVKRFTAAVDLLILLGISSACLLLGCALGTFLYWKISAVVEIRDALLKNLKFLPSATLKAAKKFSQSELQSFNEARTNGADDDNFNLAAEDSDEDDATAESSKDFSKSARSLVNFAGFSSRRMLVQSKEVRPSVDSGNLQVKEISKFMVQVWIMLVWLAITSLTLEATQRAVRVSSVRLFEIALLQDTVARLPQEAVYNLLTQQPSKQSNASLVQIAEMGQGHFENVLQGQTQDDVFGVEVPALSTEDNLYTWFQDDACQTSSSADTVHDFPLCQHFDGGVFAHGLLVALRRHFDRARALSVPLGRAASALLKCGVCAGSGLFDVQALSSREQHSLSMMLTSSAYGFSEVFDSLVAEQVHTITGTLEAAWTLTIVLNIAFLSLSFLLFMFANVPRLTRVQGILDGATCLLVLVPPELAIKNRSFRLGLHAAAEATVKRQAT